MTGSPMRRAFSVVVCTLDRAESLEQLLVALRQQTHPCFEVVVVAGPCTDSTDAVLERHASEIKAVRNPEANLSRSRNLGVAAAAGEVVAFIDDDGIPEATWLDELDAAYADDEVAGVGGVVRDHTGYAFQCRFNSADRLGRSDSTSEVPLDDLCFPGTWQFPYLIGTNSSFRRDRLVEVGGFDEEIEFYLDETDVCLRLIDAGYVLRQLDGAEVHHKFMPSSRRTSDRVTVDLFAVVKNKIYFSLVNGLGETPADQLMADNSRFAAELREDLLAHGDAGRISDGELEFGLTRLEEAWPAGLEVGYRGRVSMLEDSDPSEPTLLPFPTIAAPAGGRRHAVFVSQSLPPDDTGGIGRYMLDTARELARRGHEVRIVTTGHGHNTVDLEEGVWIHRVTKAPDAPDRPDGVPARIWGNASSVAGEVNRIHGRRPVDAVLGAMWDVETLRLLDGEVPVVTTLVTTLGITLPTKPEWTSDPAFMSDFVEPLLALERQVIERSDLVHAISDAVLEETISVSGAGFDPGRAVVSPLGVPDHLGPPSTSADSAPVVLFVGRLEKRKGIDLLLDAAPQILSADERARLVIVGRDDIPGESGRPPRLDFEDAHGDADWAGRVEFCGMVDDDELWAAYRDCTVFVAPSRFESFGLVYVEAMMAGRPVVALDSGAAREVVVDGATGRLVAADPADLASAVIELCADRGTAEAMGRAGRDRYEQHYSVGAMADSFESLLGEVAGRQS